MAFRFHSQNASVRSIARLLGPRPRVARPCGRNCSVDAVHLARQRRLFPPQSHHRLWSHSAAVSALSVGYSPAVKGRALRPRALGGNANMPSCRPLSCSVVNNGGSECAVEVVSGGREVCVVWPGKEGYQSTYHATWLKHNCQCPLCWEEATTQHLVWDKEPDPTGITVSHAMPTETGDLELTWNFASEGEQHRGSIPLKWLKENCYSCEALRRRREAATPTLATSIPIVSYSDVTKDETYLWKWLKAVNVYGLCLLTDVPTEPGTVMKTADLAGGVLETLYDKMYDVLSVENPIDVAYTTSGLPMHMDLPYYESQPGLQFLHCLRNDSCVAGGENILLDMWAVAEQLRKDHPQHFDTLTSVRVTYQRIHSDRDRPVALRRDRPHFMLDANGDLTAFYWNEGTQGPLLAPADKVDAYFEARHCLKNALEKSPLKLMHRLQPGEALVFNNRRLLHTRTSYLLNGGVRHLQGAYVGIDDFMSKVRMLARKHDPQFQAKRSFGLDPM